MEKLTCVRCGITMSRWHFGMYNELFMCLECCKRTAYDEGYSCNDEDYFIAPLDDYFSDLYAGDSDACWEDVYALE